MATYNDLLGPILARAEGCPNAVALEALRNACIDFCIRSRWYATGSQVVLTGEEVPEFDLVDQVVDICDAKITDKDVLVTYLNDPDAESDTLGGAGYDYAIRFADPNHAEITTAEGETEPSVASPLTVDLLLIIAPGPDSTEIPVDLWRRWSEQLTSGALARLFAEPGLPWSNPQLSGYHGGKFEKAITDAAFEAGRNRIQPARQLRSRSIYP